MCLLMNLGAVGFINCQHKSHLSVEVIEKGFEVWNVNFTEETKLEVKRTLQTICNRLSSRQVVKDGLRKNKNNSQLTLVFFVRDTYSWNYKSSKKSINKKTSLWFILLKCRLFIYT